MGRQEKEKREKQRVKDSIEKGDRKTRLKAVFTDARDYLREHPVFSKDHSEFKEMLKFSERYNALVVEIVQDGESGKAIEPGDYENMTLLVGELIPESEKFEFADRTIAQAYRATCDSSKKTEAEQKQIARLENFLILGTDVGLELHAIEKARDEAISRFCREAGISEEAEKESPEENRLREALYEPRKRLDYLELLSLKEKHTEKLGVLIRNLQKLTMNYLDLNATVDSLYGRRDILAAERDEADRGSDENRKGELNAEIADIEKEIRNVREKRDEAEAAGNQYAADHFSSDDLPRLAELTIRYEHPDFNTLKRKVEALTDEQKAQLTSDYDRDTKKLQDEYVGPRELRNSARQIIYKKMVLPRIMAEGDKAEKKKEMLILPVPVASTATYQAEQRDEVPDGLSDGFHLVGDDLDVSDVVVVSHAAAESGEGKNFAHAEFLNLDKSHFRYVEANFTNARLTGTRLFNTDFTRANLTDAILECVAISEGTKFIGATLSGIECQNFFLIRGNDYLQLNSKDFVTEFLVRYQSEVESHTYFREKPNFHFTLAEEGRTVGEQAFMIFKEAQENPKGLAATVLDDLVNDIHMQQKGRLVQEVSDVGKLDVSKMTRFLNQNNGLDQSQIVSLIHHMKIENDAVKTDYCYMKIGGSLPFVLHEKDNHRVINLERILTFSEAAAGQYTFDAQDFRHFVNALSAQSITADCVQMPIAIREMGREHYVHLQIYKQDDGTLGARIIDSTNNVIGIPKSQVTAMLEACREGMAKILGVNPDCAVVVSTAHTGAQPSIGDKRCGMHVMSGMQETTNRVLSEGAAFLTDTKESVKAISFQKSEQVYGKNISTNVGHAAVLLEKPEKWIAGHVNSDAVLHTSASRESALKKILLEMAGQRPSNFVDAVENALKNYRDAHGKLGFGVWRTFTHEGLDDAKGKLKKLAECSGDVKKAWAADFAYQMLSKGLSNDQLVIKNSNSRVDFMLRALKNADFIPKGVELSKANELDVIFPKMVDGTTSYVSPPVVEQAPLLRR